MRETPVPAARRTQWRWAAAWAATLVSAWAQVSVPASSWVPSAALRSSVGWRDNLLLSPFDPIARPFVRAEVEAILFRPMRDRWEVVSFLSGDVSRFLSPPAESAGEQQWLVHGEGRWQPADPLRLSLKAAGYLQDMVIDLSESEARRVVAPTRVRGGHLTFGLRLALPAGFRLEPAVQAKRNDYRDYAGDYDEVRTGARAEWKRTAALALSLGWFEARRDYDQRTQYTLGGRALPGTQLRFRQRDADAKVTTRFAARGDWTLAATAGRRENRDGGTGYFDTDQKRARLEVAWQGALWRLALDAEARRLEYRNQTVGAGISPPIRISDDYDTVLRAEREITVRWTAFAEHRWERSRSNESEFRYRANTVLAGFQLSL